MKRKPLAFYFLIIVIFLLLVYLGLNAAEKGIQEISIPPVTGRAFHISCQEKGLIIFFAGKSYRLPYSCYLRKPWQQ